MLVAAPSYERGLEAGSRHCCSWTIKGSGAWTERGARKSRRDQTCLMASTKFLRNRQITSQLRYASTNAPISQSNTPFRVFDRYVKVLQRDRAAAKEGGESSRRVDYVRDEIADRLLERFQVYYNAFTCCQTPLIYPLQFHNRTSNAISQLSWIWGQARAISLNSFPQMKARR